MSYERARHLLEEAIAEVGGLRRPAAIALVALCCAVGWWAASGGRPAAPGGEGQPVEEVAAGRAATAPSAPASAVAAPEPIVVHVAGAVRRPGLCRVPGGARVADAIREAGGARADADLSRLNLAAKAGDAQKIYVPRVGEQPLSGDAENAAEGSAESDSGPQGAAGGEDPGASPGTGLVDLNSASAAALDALPGIGPVLAQRIVDHRKEQGPFTSVEGLREVEGIGPKKFEQLKGAVVVR